MRFDAGQPDHQVLTSAVSDGTIYATTFGPSGDGRLVAAPERPTSSCTGSPPVCPPLWSASLPTTADSTPSPPVVANRVVYVTVLSGDETQPGQLLAFDANGITNCHGAPKVCDPLWTAAAAGVLGVNVDAGHLFVDTLSIDATTHLPNGRLLEFDASGTNGCAGMPKVCQPEWSAAVQSPGVPSVSGGMVYVTGVSGPNKGMFVYDEAGTTDCTGSPKVCSPLFVGTLTRGGSGSVAVSGGVAYLETQSQGPTGSSLLVAFDAAGTTECDPSTHVCQPLWTGTLTGTAFFNTPAVANGRVFVLSDPSNPQGGSFGVVDVFDASGLQGCTTSAPITCSPLATALDSSHADLFTSPTVVDDVVFVGGRAFSTDAGCVRPTSGPLTCGALWSVPNGIEADATVADGAVLISGADGFVHVYTEP
jgi:hypothetical protein